MSDDEPDIRHDELLDQLIESVVREKMDGLNDDFGVGGALNDKTPREAVEEYLNDVKRERSQGTYETHRSRLNFFIRWCEGADTDDGKPRIKYLHELDGQAIRDFRDWRRASGWRLVTEKHQLQTLRKFLRKCAKPEWVPENLHKKVPVPKVDSGEESRDTIIRQSTLDQVLSHLEKFEYASLMHCQWLVMGRTACRISGLLALDVADYEPDDETGKAILKFKNREDAGTRLKNGNKSERHVEVEEDVRKVIDDYLEHQRPDVTDEYGREPLFATENGRPSDSTVRKYVYMWSRPCEITGECPYDRDIEQCDAAQDNGRASGCPASVSPHPIRRGRITWHLNQGALPPMIAEMYDVTPETMKKHYDERTPAEKQRLGSMWTEMIRDQLLENAGGWLGE